MTASALYLKSPEDQWKSIRRYYYWKDLGVDRKPYRGRGRRGGEGEWGGEVFCDGPASLL